MVAEMVRLGALSPQAAARHPYRHAVTNILGGTEPGVRAELHKLDLEPDDTGLSEMVSDERIAAILQDEQEPQRACERLVAEANEKGGKDNITVIVGRFQAS